MFRILSGESLFQAGLTALIGSLAFVRTDEFELTTLGKTVFILVVITLIVIIRSTVVPPYRPQSNVSPLHRNGKLKPPPKSEAEPGILATITFAGLLFGIVKWSWFGILPNLAAEIGLPVSLTDQVAAALSIGLLVGTVALAAFGIVEILQVDERSPLVRKNRIVPPKHQPARRTP